MKDNESSEMEDGALRKIIFRECDVEEGACSLEGWPITSPVFFQEIEKDICFFSCNLRVEVSNSSTW